MKSLLFALAASAAAAVSAQSAMKLASQLEWANPADGKKIVVELQKLGKEGVKELVANLKEANDKPVVQASFALESLVQYSSRPGADAERAALAAALAENIPAAVDDVAKGVVVKALELCGSDAQVPAIVPMLDNPKVRTYAIFTLVQINSENSRKALRDAAAKASPEVALEYAPAFNKLKDAAAADLLLKMLDAAKPHQRSIVFTALANIGYAPAADLMLAELKAKTAFQRAAASGALSLLINNVKDKAVAIDIAKKFYDAQPGEASLTALLDAQGPEAMVDNLLVAAANGDFVRREAMMKLLEGQPKAIVTPKAIEAAKTAKPEVAAAIVGMLGRAADPAALPFVTESLGNANAEVRAAAAEAITSFGVDNGVKELVAKLATATDKADINVLKNALSWQQSDAFAATAAAAIPQATKQGKIALAEVLASRKAVAQSAPVFAMLAGDADEAKAALKALEVLAVPADTQKVLDFMLKTESSSLRKGAQTVLTQVARVDEKAAQTVVAALKDAPIGAKVILLQTMPKIGNAPALEAVVANLDAQDADLKNAAVRALADWPNFAAAPALEKIAAQKDNAVHRVLALRALIRVSALKEGKSPAQIVENLKKAQALCINNDEQKLILSAIGDIRSDEALKDIVIPAFENPELVAEASVAATNIACSRNNNDRGLLTMPARTALEQVLAKSGNDDLKAKAQAQLGKFPPAGVNVAFGKPVKTSCPQQGNHSPEKAVDGIITRDASWFGNQWPSWITVDLLQPETINFIKPTFYWDGTRSYAYTIEVSDDNQNWKKVVDMAANKAPATEQGIAHAILPAVTARYVRLNILKNSVNEAVHLVELEVFSLTGKQPKAAGPNLLFRQPVTAGSQQEEHYSPDRLTDGKIGKTDGWHTDQCPTWITVDMQQVAEIDTARVIFYWDGNRTYSYNIEVSEDNQKWTKVADVPNNTVPADAQGFVHKFKPIKAQYVKLNVTKGVGPGPNGKYVHVVELEAYAAGKAPAQFPAAEKPVIKAPPLPPADKDGFINLFNGKDFTGWMGSVGGYGIEDGGIMFCDPKKGGKILTQWQFSDFELHFDFLLSLGANNGLAIRAPEEGDPAYVGMELQIIDNDGYKKHKGGLAPWQHHGSIYGVVPAKQGALKPAGEWNHEHVIAKGTKIKVIVNDQVIVDADIANIQQTADGKGRAKHPGLDRRTGHIGWLGHGDLVKFKNIRIKPIMPYEDEPINVAPEGYVPLFNGRDLTGWKGLLKGPADNPEVRAKMNAEQLAAAQKEADEVMRAHWKVVDGALHYDGKGRSLCTVKDYADFDMYCDWKITAHGDSGLYLRGAPQVQIWDPNQWKIGSGGLYNNQKNPSKALVIADNPIGQWNRFRIKMVGERVSVWLNGILVVDNTIMENYWNRRIPIYPSGQIELQHHGSHLEFRNIYIKELK